MAYGDLQRRVAPALRLIASGGVIALPVLLIVGPAAGDIAISIIAILFILRSLVTVDWRWLEEPWVLVGLGVWIYLMLNAAYVAADRVEAMHRATPFGRFVVFAAALQFWLLVDRATVRRLLAVLTATLAFVAADCMVQYVTGSDLLGRPPAGPFRLTGPFSEPVPGIFLAHLAFPVLAVGWNLAAGSRPGTALAMAATALLGLAVALTGERTALFMVAFGLTLLALLRAEARRPLLATGVAGAVVLGVVLAVQPSLQQRLIEHTTADFTNFWERRVGELLLRGQQVWRENPLLGIGPSNFRHECARDDFEPRGPVETRCYTHPHHVWNEWLAETGLVGFAGFVTLLVLWSRSIVAALRRGSPDAALLTGLAIALVVILWPLRPSMSFFSTWSGTIFWLLLGWALALAAPGGRGPPGKPVSSPS